MTDFKTLPEAFQAISARRPDDVALRTSDGRLTFTWREYSDSVRRIAGGFAALGLKRGDTFAALLTNRPEFNITEAAASHLGATTFSIYNTSSPEQINYLLTHSGARMLVTERQYVDSVAASGADVEQVLVVEDGDLDALKPSEGFDFEAAWTAVEPDDVLCLIYTSGTTGPPKGVEHTHRGTLAMSDAVSGFWPSDASDVGLSYLPAAHAGDRYFSHYFAMVNGFQTVSLADTRQLPVALREIRPTIFIAVPRIWHKLRAGLEAKLSTDKDLSASFTAGNPEVAHALRAAIGLDRLNWALSGAAPIPPEDFGFLQRLGLPVSEMWGMSECGMCTGAPAGEARQGTVGRAPAGIELRIASDGEMLVRSPAVMRGYRNDAAETAAAIDADGWLHTGDVCTIDEDGYVRVVDRKKELIINAGGKNMSPINIEHSMMVNSSLIGHVVAIGDARPYNVALVTLDPDAAQAFATAEGLDPSPAELATHPRVIAAVQEAIDAGNQKLSRIEQVKRFALLETFWEAGGDELTPTSKLKRRPIAEKYAARIEELYATS